MMMHWLARHASMLGVWVNKYVRVLHGYCKHLDDILSEIFWMSYFEITKLTYIDRYKIIVLHQHKYNLNMIFFGSLRLLHSNIYII